MKILITGAGGFLGRNFIAETLQATEYELIAATSQREGLWKQWGDGNGRLTVIENSALVEVDWKSVNILLNCAFPRNVDEEQMVAGLKFISDTILAATNGDVGAVINISSQSVYSQERLEPATEHTSLSLDSKYAIGKYVTELLINTMCAKIPHTNIRLASLIGPEFNQRITNKFIDEAIAGNNLKLIGGRQRFGFLDIRDAVSGLLVMIQSNPENWDELYNLGTNESYTLEQIANEVCCISTELYKQPIAYDLVMSDNFKNSTLDCSKFYKKYEWCPAYSFNATLQRIFESKAQR